MSRVVGLTLIVACVLALAAGPAGAALSAVGPVNPANSFPLWFQDSTGLMLQLGLDPALTFFDPPIAGNAVSVARGFGQEAFYFLADAVGTVPVSAGLPAGGEVLLVLAVEAAYLNGPPVAGEEITFGRIRIRIDAPVAGTYRVIHPYGTESFIVTTPGRRAINNTVDVIGQTPNFVPTLATQVGPFLRAVAPAAPAGFIGHPVNLQTVAGSPTGRNYFRVEGPPGSNLGGPGVNVIQLNQFTLSGQIFVPPAAPPGQPPPPLPTPLVITRATALVDLRQIPSIDIFATSMPTATVKVTLPGRPPVAMTGDATGNFFTRIVLARRTAIPASLSVSATAPGTTATTTTGTINIVDSVTIRLAQYDRGKRTLQVIALSSNNQAQNGLIVVGLGPMTKGILARTNLAVPPANVTVESPLGGSATAPVQVK